MEPEELRRVVSVKKGEVRPSSSRGARTLSIEVKIHSGCAVANEDKSFAMQSQA